MYPPGKQTQVDEGIKEAEHVLLVAHCAGDPHDLVVEDQTGDEAGQDKLDHLDGGDHLGYHPRHHHLHGLHGVVGVHHRVDRVVHNHEQPAGGGQENIGVEAHPHDTDVMIPVEEYQLLFPQHDEGRVEELHDLGEDEEVGPEAGHPVLRDEGGAADGLVEAAPGQHLEELSPGPQSPRNTEDGQTAAPHSQRPPQVKWRSEVRIITDLEGFEGTVSVNTRF